MTTGTGARCGKSCCGAGSMGASGCRAGCPALPEPADLSRPSNWPPLLASNGSEATADSLGTGAERVELANGQTISARCTDCMVGQGGNCRCRPPADPRAMRWLLLAVACFWGWLLTWVMKGCSS